MNISYAGIAEANKGIAYTDIKGKNYAEVAQRVQAFRKLIPGGYITTEIISNENGIVYMKAEAGYYENGQRVMLATGYAFERQDASNLNKTSFIENCETSAVGRALGFIGLGSEKSIASAEEVDNAIRTQEAIENGKLPDPTRNRKSEPKKDEPKKDAQKKDEPKQGNQGNQPAGSVSTAPTIPNPQNPVATYLARERKNLQKLRGISEKENMELFTRQLAVLRANKRVPDKALSKYTQEEAEGLISKMYSCFTQTGTELKEESA